jgi:GT2 family glycosyltransferase
VITAVLVNWQQADRTIQAVRALEQQSLPINYIIIIDNGSADNSEAILKSSLPLAHVIRNQVNIGFGSGCNIGINKAISLDSDYVLLINNDALPEKDLLQKMLFRMKQDSMIGVVGACIQETKDAVIKHAGTVMNPISFT